MLFLVLFAFIGIKLEVHLVLESRIFSAKIKPFLLKRQRAGNHLWCLRRTIVGPFSGFLGSSRFIAGVVSHPANRLLPFTLPQRDVRKVAVPNATRSKSMLEEPEALALYHG